MMIMAFPADDIVSDCVKGFGGIGTKLVLERVGHVLWVSGMVCVVAGRAVEVQGAVGAGHERAVDGELVQVYADAVVLCVAVEEHAEL